MQKIYEADLSEGQQEELVKAILKINYEIARARLNGTRLVIELWGEDYPETIHGQDDEGEMLLL